MCFIFLFLEWLVYKANITFMTSLGQYKIGISKMKTRKQLIIKVYNKCTQFYYEFKKKFSDIYDCTQKQCHNKVNEKINTN